jgi:diguanylate cyclase (GGDEF)-like protein
MPLDLEAVIGRVGSFSQLGSLALIALLTGAVFYSRRQVLYFRHWTLGWGSYVVALIALVTRYSTLPVSGGTVFVDAPESAAVTRALYLVYLVAKFFFFALVAYGTWMFVRPADRRPPVWSLAVGSLAVGSLFVAVSTSLDRIMAYQSAVAVPVFVGCAGLLLSLERRQRSLGTSALTIAFVAHAILWVAYCVGFSIVSPGADSGVLNLLLTFNSFIDALLQTLLAYGMVLVVMEQTTRESQAANAELERAHLELQRAAFYDPLSGALNRHAFAEGMGIDHSSRTRGTVIVLDVDHLKPINDSLGHDAGDALIREVARAIQAGIGTRDAVYRWGGDEFLIVFADCDPITARQRLTEGLLKAASIEVAGVLVPVRASFGTAEFSGPESLAQAISRADRAMYEAKSTRRVSRETPVDFRAASA